MSYLDIECLFCINGSKKFNVHFFLICDIVIKYENMINQPNPDKHSISFFKPLKIDGSYC